MQFNQLINFLYIRFADLQDRMKEDRGATAVEYGLMVSLIAVVIIVVVGLIGQRLNIAFGKVRDAFPAS